MNQSHDQEIAAVRTRYSRRERAISQDRYSLLRPENLYLIQERQRVLARYLSKRWGFDLSDVSLTEVGCGTGSNLLEFVQMGFNPKMLTGIELLESRCEIAKERLPTGVKLHCADASAVDIKIGSQDVVFQSVVFSSILDGDVRTRIAETMWRWLAPSGMILWYDFIYNNPANRDVRGVPVGEIKKLFPQGKFLKTRVTLAPPIGRMAVKVHPFFYRLLNRFIPLRTHVVCVIQKSAVQESCD